MRNRAISRLACVFAAALGANAAPLISQTDVFVSGRDGYHTYRIPAVEAAPDGSLVAFGEARKYNASDPGFGQQDIDLVYKRSTDNGVTWSHMTVLDDPGELWSAANPATLVDRTSHRLWVFYLRSRPGRSTDTARPGTDDMQTLARWSDDNGFISFTRLNREWLEAPEPQTASLTTNSYKIISRGETAGTYQAFPDICRLKNGDLLCVFYAGYGHVSLPKEACPKGGRICSVRSTDEGRTWSAPRVLLDSPSDDRDPHIAQMRDGSVVCSFFTYRPQPGGKVICDTCLVTSRDGGESWETEPCVVAAGWPSSAPVRELADGTRLLGVYHEEGATAYGGVIRSVNGGKTWSDPIPIGKDSGVRLDAETDFVVLKDGTVYAALRGDRVPMHFATSIDQGLTWSPVKDIGFPGHCPHFTRLSKGLILLSHRLPLTALHVSRDEGKTWQGPYQIDSTPGAYPSTVELKDGTVLVVYYEEGERSAVRARRFTVGLGGIEFLDLESIRTK